jgi:GDP-D-mannose 3',5'-epimerase
MPDNEYGWEKLFSERMYQSYNRNYGLDIKVARFHSIVGPGSQWDGDKAKAHSALARKVAMVEDGGSIEVIGDGTQTRTFLYIDDCLDAVRLLMNSDTQEIMNIGSDHLVSIIEYIKILKEISQKNFSIKFIDGPTGVIGRQCSIEKIKEVLGWQPKISLYDATERTYNWIKSEIDRKIK